MLTSHPLQSFADRAPAVRYVLPIVCVAPALVHVRVDGRGIDDGVVAPLVFVVLIVDDVLVFVIVVVHVRCPVRLRHYSVHCCFQQEKEESEANRLLPVPQP